MFKFLNQRSCTYIARSRKPLPHSFKSQLHLLTKIRTRLYPNVILFSSKIYLEQLEKRKSLQFRVLNWSERKAASGISRCAAKVFDRRSLFYKLLILCLYVSIFLSLSDQVHRKTLNPVFNETFKFSVSWAKFFHAFCPLMFMLYYSKLFSLVLPFAPTLKFYTWQFFKCV
jgi:hypothetical protein